MSKPNDDHKPAGLIRRLLGRRRWVVVGLVALAVLLLSSSTHVRLGLKSGGFLVEVFPDAPAYPARWFAEEPHRVLVQFDHEGEHHTAYLYRPAESGCHAGIVMYIGLGPEHGDPHLDRISRAFARSGVAVLIPVSHDMVEYRLSATEHLVAASAFQAMQRFPDVDPARVGLFGISVGGSIVVNAAQEEEINEQVAMVNSLGGYFDGVSLLASMAVGSYEIEGERIPWEPSSTTWRATRNSILALMSSSDRVALWPLFDDDANDIPDDLSEDGLALARLLVNDDPERLDELTADLPAELVGFLNLISPSQGLENLTAPTLLLHDKYDHVLPYSQTLEFADASPEWNQPYVTIIEQFHHVRPDVEGDRLSLLGDGWKLYRHIYRMHREIDDRSWFTSPLNLLPFVGQEELCG
jgi:pimeloyl-ACP methyl ester carboxylesterase